MMRTDIPGKRKRGRPGTRWKDACQLDLIITGMRAGEETTMHGDVEKEDMRPYMMTKPRGQKTIMNGMGIT